VIEYLPPIADFQKQFHTPATGTHFDRMADAIPASTQISGSVGQTDIFEMQDLNEKIQLIEAVARYFYQTNAPLDHQLIEPEGTQTFSEIAGTFIKMVPTAFGAVPWTPEKVNALRYGLAVPNDAGANRAMNALYLMAVRSPALQDAITSVPRIYEPLVGMKKSHGSAHQNPNDDAFMDMPKSPRRVR